MSSDEAGPFLSGTTESDAAKTIAKGTAHEAAKRHINGVINATDGMLSMKERTTRAVVAKTESKDPTNTDLTSPK